MIDAVENSRAPKHRSHYVHMAYTALLYCTALGWTGPDETVLSACTVHFDCCYSLLLVLYARLCAKKLCRNRADLSSLTFIQKSQLPFAAVSPAVR